MGADQTLRCERCGIESVERSCFIVPERHAAGPHDTRCITCETSGLARSVPAQAASAFLVAIGVPLGWLALWWPRLFSLWAVPLAVMLVPLAIIAHELGHALTGWLLGLEVGQVEIGRGPLLAGFELGGVSVRLHFWPMSGRVIFGGRSLRLLRTRLWLAIAMRPVTSGSLLLLTVAYRAAWVALAGGTAVHLWGIINFWLALSSALPAETVHVGRKYQSDGLRLLRIPRVSPEVAQKLLLAAPAVRAMAGFERGDFVAARRWFQQALEREPGNKAMAVSLGACHLNVHEYAQALALLMPILEGAADLDARTRATLHNNLALALLMSHIERGAAGAGPDEPGRLSAAAFETFPCVLTYRSTRALMLALRGRCEEALALLDYVHYRGAGPREASWCEAVRACTLTGLGRQAQALASA
jgi:hypothetical protein